RWCRWARRPRHPAAPRWNGCLGAGPRRPCSTCLPYGTAQGPETHCTLRPPEQRTRRTRRPTSTARASRLLLGIRATTGDDRGELRVVTQLGSGYGIAQELTTM